MHSHSAKVLGGYGQLNYGAGRLRSCLARLHKPHIEKPQIIGEEP